MRIQGLNLRLYQLSTAGEEPHHAPRVRFRAEEARQLTTPMNRCECSPTNHWQHEGATSSEKLQAHGFQKDEYLLKHKRILFQNVHLTLEDAHGDNLSDPMHLIAPYLDYCTDSGVAKLGERTMLQINGIGPTIGSKITWNATLGGGAVMRKGHIDSLLHKKGGHEDKLVSVRGSTDAHRGLSLDARAKHVNIDISKEKFVLQGGVDVRVYNNDRVTEGLRTSIIKYDAHSGQLCMAEEGLQTHAEGHMTAAFIAKCFRIDEGFLSYNVIN